MSVKVKMKLEAMQKILEKVRREFSRELGDEIGPHLGELMESGISPVAGQGRFKKYSDSYTAAIKSGQVGNGKTVRPVNLKVTGALHNSQKIKVSDNKVTVLYKDSKAKYHNEGTPKMPRRAMIPTNQGERFYSPIQKNIMAILKRIVDKYVR